MLRDGLYETPLNQGLEAQIKDDATRRAEFGKFDPADSHIRLARYLIDEIARVLKDLGKEPTDQAALVNEVLQFIWKKADARPDSASQLSTPERLLLAVYRGVLPERPSTPLALSQLLAKPGNPNLGHEIAKEIASADRVDALVSFVTWNGFRRLKPALEGHSRAGRPFRLITTTYTGATEADAVKAIAELPHAEVRVSYDGRRSRLHAKAWLFHRDTGFSSAYIGSANLSAAALSSGIEWTVKAAEADLPGVVEVFRGTFDGLWSDEEFERFRPADDYDKLAHALRAAKGGGGSNSISSPGPLFFTLRPYPFQQEILDRLKEQRESLGRRRNLIVAATGTGKTMIAAFDYARQPQRPRLLFLAHRREILEQALYTFRHVLHDEAFGALLTGGDSPASPDHLFATVQSFLNSGWVARLGGEHWPFVVVDECHHMPAPSYREALGRLRPHILLGLTATPERADNESLLPDFDHHIAAEIRLWHALEKQLVVPFEYYGLPDDTDLRGVEWTRGAYALSDLESILTGNDRRAEMIAEQFQRLRSPWTEARALAFCVSVKHADFMARTFNAMGIPSMAVHGDSPDVERQAAPRKLRELKVNVIFTCDLYNEGVDMPWIDTLLLLRPTSSTTVFLQQLGRGLRLDEGKGSCLVLDFIGQHRREFRFDAILSAMTGIPRGKLIKAVEADFPTLPAGCHMNLDRVARERIVANLKEKIGGGAARLRSELAQMASSVAGPVTLACYLADSGRDLGDVYAVGGWTTLKRAAGLLSGAAPDGESRLNRRFEFLCHIDDVDRLKIYREAATPSTSTMIPAARRQWMMLGYQIFHEPDDKFSVAELLVRLREQPELVKELAEICDVLLDRAHPTSTPPIESSWPICLHRTYSRREIQTAVGHWNEERKPSFREGVLTLKDVKAELLFVTLDKSRGGFTTTTSYDDYAISPTEFHWQSQSHASEESEAGRRYTEQVRNGWRFFLFVRPTVDDEFVALGSAKYLKHYGERPLSIHWLLEAPMPAALFQKYARLYAA